MFFTDTKRILRTGFLNFFRNGFVSLASVLVITITLFVIGSLLFFSAVMEASLSQLKDKVDINVYFVTDALPEDILSLQGSLEKIPEVDSVSYTSREEALIQFRERHQDDFLTIQALEELDENPLRASLNVKAKQTTQYEAIARFLDDQNEIAGSAEIIDKINYYQNKIAIDKLTKIISSAEKLGFYIVLILVVISIIITFNTIRLAIYSSREEIAVMRLVGASNRYVGGPFIFEGFIYGFISAIIVMGVLYPITLWLGDVTEQFFGGINVAEHYVDNFWKIFLILLTSGILLGVVSSTFAIRRYVNKKYIKN